MSISVFDYIDPDRVYIRDYDVVFILEAVEKDLTCFPEDLFKLSRLSLLDLTENNISIIPPEISKLTRLKNAYLSYNCIKEITPELCNLNLKRLELGWNPISIIPPEISNLVNLQRITLNNSHITKIPPELGNLSNLKELFLNDNKITEIPVELYQLLKLNTLDLQNNNITKVKFDKNLTNFLSKIYDLKINISCYDMKNLDIECEVLIFTRIYNNLTNLPANLKAICFSEKVENHFSNKNADDIKKYNIKIDLPPGCEIIYFSRCVLL
jgi:Leucine-rich repeat (LRR) protein